MDHFAGSATVWSSFFYTQESLWSNNTEAGTLVVYVTTKKIDAMEDKGTVLMLDLVTFRRSQSPVHSPGSTSQPQLKKDYINSCMLYIQIRINVSGEGAQCVTHSSKNHSNLYMFCLQKRINVSWETDPVRQPWCDKVDGWVGVRSDHGCDSLPNKKMVTWEPKLSDVHWERS